MKPKPEPIPPDLLIRFLSGECSAQEAALVQDWIDASEANHREYTQFKAIWEMSGDALPPPLPVDTDAAWAAVAARLDSRNEIKQSGTSANFGFPFWLKVAAVLLPLIGTGIWLMMDRKPSEPELLSLSTLQADTLLQLPDGSGIHLNRNSHLRYAKGFDENQREVFLEGEAFLKVEPDTSRPFIVHTPLLKVVVLGTEFNVKTLPDQSTASVTVQSGTVGMYVMDSLTGFSDSIVLKPGDKGIYECKSRQLRVVRAETGADFFWKTRHLRFVATPLKDVFTILEQCYPVSITSRDSAVLSLRLTSEFQDQPIDRVLMILGETLGIRHTQTGNTYEFLQAEP